MATKVLMYGWEFPPHNSGGLGVACMGLSRALTQEGFDITFVLPKGKIGGDEGVKMKLAGTDDIKYKGVNSPVTPYMSAGEYEKKYGKKSGLRGSIYGDSLMAEVRRYALLGGKLVKEDNYDVIYAHDWLSFGAGLEARRISGKPLIVHIHATEFDRTGGSGVNEEVYQVEYDGFHEADCIIAVSQYTKDMVVRHYGIPEEKVVVVHNGIDDVTFPYEGGRNDQLRGLKSAGYKVVLYYGRITIQKGVDYLIKAACKVLEKNPKVIFLIVGSGDMQRQLMQEASYYKIGDKVLFHDFMRGQALADTIASSDLVVMPSVSEPFGIVPLEAMKLGTPVLISKQSGVSEVVKNALKVDFWDTDEMANKILGVLGYSGLSATLRGNGLEEVVHISWERAAKKLRAIIERLKGFFGNK
jgi:glycosyltransferase involved in cell wall biosynthesis